MKYNAKPIGHHHFPVYRPGGEGGEPDAPVILSIDLVSGTKLQIITSGDSVIVSNDSSFTSPTTYNSGVVTIDFDFTLRYWVKAVKNGVESSVKDFYIKPPEGYSVVEYVSILGSQVGKYINTNTPIELDSVIEVSLSYNNYAFAAGDHHILGTRTESGARLFVEVYGTSGDLYFRNLGNELSKGISSFFRDNRTGVLKITDNSLFFNSVPKLTQERVDETSDSLLIYATRLADGSVSTNYGYGLVNWASIFKGDDKHYFVFIQKEDEEPVLYDYYSGRTSPFEGDTGTVNVGPKIVYPE